MNVPRQRTKFTWWCDSRHDPNYPRTLQNTQDEFTVQLEAQWVLSGTWSVIVSSLITSEVKEDENKIRGDLLVYSNLIQSELVGHNYFPLMEWIPTSGKAGARHQESLHPLRRRVNGKYHEALSFKIVDAYGQKPDWSTNQPTIICLEFSPEADDFDTQYMEQTFLSNQDLPFHPNNQASEFTVRLPGIQRMGDQWRVGITKLTLPPAVVQEKSMTWVANIVPPSRDDTTITTLKSLGKVKTESDLAFQFNTTQKVVLRSVYTGDKGGLGGGGNIDTREWNADYAPSGVLSLPQLIKWAKTNIEHDLSVSDQGTFQIRSASDNPLIYDTPDLPTRLGFVNPTVTFTRNPNGFKYVADKLPFVDSNSDPNGVYLVGMSLTYDATTKKMVLDMGYYQLRDKYEMKLAVSEGLVDALKLPKTGTTTTVDTWGDTIRTYLAKPGLKYPNHVTGPFDKLQHYHCTRLESTSPLNNVEKDANGYIVIVKGSTLTPLEKNVYVTCSLVNPQHVGNRLLPLMEIVPTGATVVGESNKSKQYVYEPQRVRQYPLSTTSFQSIKFNLDDQDGNPISFHPAGVATLTLTYQKAA